MSNTTEMRKLSTESDELSFMSDMSGIQLLSRREDVLSLSTDERRNVAIYENGVAVVAEGKLWSPIVKSVLDRVRRKSKLKIDVVEAKVPFILGLHESSLKMQAPEDDSNLVERQRDLMNLIAKAADMKASDIHIRVLPSYTEVRVRVYGRMMDIETLSREVGGEMIRAAMAVASDRGSAATDMTFQKGALTRKSGLLPRGVDMIRLQYSPTTEQRGAIVMRLKYAGRPGDRDIDSLGYSPEQMKELSQMRRRTNGMYLLAGKVSSGKSTTLQRVLNSMYVEKGGEITMFSIEEPIELDLQGAIQCAITSEDASAFIDGMKSSLRSDPNIIILGELRDKDLAYLAVQAAMTGHALWSTVHAGSALGILDRLTDLGVDTWKLADPSIVRGLIYQRLLGTLCPHCRITFKQAVERKKLDIDLAKMACELFGIGPDKLYVRGPGCDKCDMGLNGRTVAAETIQTDPHLLDLFTEGKRSEMRKYWLKPASEGGMGGKPTLHHALAKVGAGWCDINEVEEEVDLLSEYVKNFPQLKDALRQDVARIRADRKEH